MRNLIDKIEENANIDKSFKKEVYRKAIHLSSLWIPALIYSVSYTHLTLPTT